MGLLRFLLALSVVVSHTSAVSGYKLVGGVIAVEIFFILSGFYMALVLNEKYTYANGGFKIFVGNRFLKVFPVYFLVLFLSFFVNYLDGSGIFNLNNDIPLAVNILGLLTNVTLFGQDLLHFISYKDGGFVIPDYTRQFGSNSMDHLLVLPQSWTLALELYFYVIIYFVLNNKYKVYILGFILLFSWAVKVVFYTNDLISSPYSYRFFASELYLFMYGVGSYYLYVKVKTIKFHPVLIGLIYFILMSIVVYFFLILQEYINLSITGPVDIYYKESIYIVFILVVPILFHVSRKNRLDMMLGDLSYPIYIVHLLIPQLINILEIKKNPVTLLMYIIISSILLNYIIQKPIESYRKRRVAGSTPIHRTLS